MLKCALDSLMTRPSGGAEDTYMLLLFTGSTESTDLLFWQFVVEHHRYFGGINCHNSLCACLGMFHSSR